MKKTFVVKLFLCACLSLFSSGIFALDVIKTGDSLKDNAYKANRRTALRCLELAKNYVQSENYNAVMSQVSLGLTYDDTISDLWFILASAKNAMGGNIYSVEPCIQKALELNNWVDYNRDAARIMYADILCDTGRFDRVATILDQSPRVYSSDAEFIRAKAYYRLGDGENVLKARNAIDGARRIYPKDTRFPLLFFKYESPEDDNSDVRRLSQIFIQNITQYVEASPDKDAELEIYAALFASGDDRDHLLKSFSARGLSHPLYARLAYEQNLIQEQEAFEYISTFADSGIEFNYLADFMPVVKTKNIKKQASEYFNAFDGIVLFDTDGDGIINMHVKYSRGRPETVFYDRNQDGNIEWSIVCDFGEPVAGTVTDNKMDFTWNHFPYLETVSFRDSENKTATSYTIVQESLKYCPVNMVQSEKIDGTLDCRFFIPLLNEDDQIVTKEKLMENASSLTLNLEREKDSTICFTMLNGSIADASYYNNGVLYAQSVFQDGLPKVRNVDADRDGIFETIEYYETDSENSMEAHSLEEERVIMENIFGYPSVGAGFYLRMVQIDTNNDTVPDFAEEYFAGGNKVSTWDNNGDGMWDVRNIVNSDGTACAVFVEVPSGKQISIWSKENVPFKVDYDGNEMDIYRDAVYDFYWIGQTGNPQLALKAIIELTKCREQGISMVVQEAGERMLCVRMGSLICGSIIEQIFPEDVSEAADEEVK